METPAESKVTSGLATLLADSYALAAQTQLAHWNVEGPDFFHLHTAFQAQYEDLFAAIDEIAERIRALGAYAPGGLSEFASTSKIKELPQGAHPALEFVNHLVDSHMVLLQNARNLRDMAGEMGDAETQDLVIGRLQVHEKALWMLRSFAKKF